ncbi:RNA polymerase sigma factor [Cohnella terricola]|uniref:RNA polymerase sigma factor n=1 Tax=Cohnella terricola TaxID=1289167 RepID=A0A559JPZ9_9BACL|nr:RNA polymerase sigma factor [Cohnella terricola]TVY01966.1 RNA polymerase sigma factor [Cohnella terricola]
MDGHARIEQWFMEYGSDVHHFLVYYTGWDHVDDLVQDVFVKALIGIRRYEGRSSPKTWLFSIARRVAIDEQRKRKRRSLHASRYRSENCPPDRTPEEIIFLRQDLADAHSCVMKLKRSYRDVLFLRVMEKLSAAEAAEVLGWSVTRVNVTLHRAIRKARFVYEELNGGVGE